MRWNPLHHHRVRTYLERHVLCRVDTDRKVVALTFDDGPNPNHTPRLLDMLARKGVRATFFLVGRRVRRYGDIARSVFEAGHEIGNHTDMHFPLTMLPRWLIRREIRVADELLAKHTDSRPRFMRPPMGLFNNTVLEVVRETGYTPVIGTIHPKDSRRPGTDAIVSRVMPMVTPGAIIILHDGGWREHADRGQSVDAADRITDQLLEEGYHLQTLSELVG